MRVLHIDTGAEMRGGQWQALYLLRGLRQRGHDCLLLARQGAPLFEKAAGEGFSVQEANWRNARKQAGCDVVHAHDARGHTLAVFAGFQNLVVSRRVAFPVRTGIASRWKYAKPVLFLAVSEYVGKKLSAAGIDEKRIRVVYDGVPVLEPQTVDGPFLAPATDDPRKGSALAREAAALAGVELRFTKDLMRELPGARGLLYLTEEEGLGSGILLAMSAGVAVVASGIGGIPEIVRHGQTGLLTENRATEVAAALRRLMEDAPLAATMAAEARRQVLERFTLDAMVGSTLGAYKEALA